MDNQGVNTKTGSSVIEKLKRRTVQDVRFFVACIYIATLIIAILTAYGGGVLTTLERRYQWSNSELGILASMSHAGTLCSLPFISYFLGRPNCHRPRWIAMGVVVIGLGGMLATLPQFVGDVYDYTSLANTTITNSPRVHVCQKSMQPFNDSSCGVNDIKPTTNNIKYVFYLAFFLAGMGYAPIPTLGVSYIDDFAGKKSPVYIGLIESTFGIGLPCGFILSAATLMVYVDFYRVDMTTVDMATSDHRWIGAWWIGFALVTVVMFLIAIPIACFPRSLHTTQRSTRKVDKLNYTTISTDGEKLPVVSLLKDFFKSAWLILTCPIFMLTNFAYSIDKPVGMVLFLPKYFVKDLYYSVSTANVLMAGTWLLPMAPTRLFAGVLVKRLAMGLNGLAKMCLIVTTLTLVFVTLMIPLSCEGETMANTGSTSTKGLVVPSCNGDCQCSTDNFFPVCGADNLTYFSPCYAGCTHTVDGGFGGCKCVSALNTSMSPSIVDTADTVTTGYSVLPSTVDTADTVTPGYCSYEPCQFVVVFLVLSILSVMSQSSTAVPTILLSMIAVRPELKSYALGFRYIMLRVLSNVPGPIISGYLLDSTCTQWQTNCGQRGACVAYDNYQFRMIMIGMNILLTGVAAVTYAVLVMYVYWKGKHATNGEMKLKGSKNDEVNKNNESDLQITEESLL